MDASGDKPGLGRAERHPEKAHRPDNPIRRKPDWIRVRAPNSPEYAETRKLMRQYGLATVCEEAACPNIGECWKHKHATFMIMGETCTRACAFCNVATGKPGALNPHEPTNIAEAVGKLGLGHVVVTSVDRDDLPDGGATHFAETINAIRTRLPGCKVEVLIPDFNGRRDLLDIVLRARPEVLAHNLEILRSLSSLDRLGCPILVGPSRKSFLGQITGLGATERLHPTAAAVAVAALHGAHIVRVHDVREMRQVAQVVDAVAQG